MQGCFQHQEVRCCGTSRSSLVGQRLQLAAAAPRQQLKRSVACQVAANVKLPATHTLASQAALQAIKASKTVNRKWPRSSSFWVFFGSQRVGSAALLWVWSRWLEITQYVMTWPCRLRSREEEQHYQHRSY